MHARLVIAALFVATLGSVSSADDAASSSKVFSAGAFAADITPLELPISVNGGMQDRQATSVHDRLHARCLVLDDGRERIAIVVCDVCAIPRDVCDTAKQLAAQASGIPENHILISATHTHEAPTLTAVFQSEPDPRYQHFVAEQIAKGIQTAKANLEPARITWAVGQNSEQVFNRRWKMKPGTVPPNPFGKTDLVKMNPGYRNPGLVEPAGKVDPDVTAVSVQARDGRPIAVLGNYSLHYVGSVEPLSADYFGAFAERIGKLIGAKQANPAFVGIMSNGTSGDINNINFAGPPPTRRATYDRIEEVADSVAKTAYDALQQAKPHDWVPLAMSEREIELGVRLPSAADIEEAKEIMAKAPGGLFKTSAEIYAHETVMLAKYPPRVRAKLQAIRIGDVGIVSSPCETFVETGAAIKAGSPLKTTFTIELANGYNGYLPTPEQHQLGGYETWRARSSYLAEDAAPKITATLLELLKEVAK